MKNIILIDIDHTISDAFWRDDLIQKSRDSNDWEEYHSRGKDDKPLEDMIRLVNLIAHGIYEGAKGENAEVWAITARPEKWRKQTMEWFMKHGVNIDNLLMRPENEYKGAPDIKMDLCKSEGILDNILCMFDDREDVVARFNAYGITAFQVHAARRKEG